MDDITRSANRRTEFTRPTALDPQRRLSGYSERIDHVGLFWVFRVRFRVWIRVRFYICFWISRETLRWFLRGGWAIATYRADCRTAFERCQVFTARLLWLFAPVSCSSASAVLWIWQRLLQFEPTWRPRGEFPTSVRGELTTRALSVRSDEESSAIRERTVGQEVRRRDTRSLEGLAGVYVMLQRIHRK